MKKCIITVCAFMMCFNLMIAANDVLSHLDFQCEMIKAYKGMKKFPKAPVRCPYAFINGHTLNIEGCDGCVIQLLCGDDIVYSTVITDGIVELPEDLSGVYRLQILRGDYCFWAEIEL